MKCNTITTEEIPIIKPFVSKENKGDLTDCSQNTSKTQNKSVIHSFGLLGWVVLVAVGSYSWLFGSLAEIILCNHAALYGLRRLTNVTFGKMYCQVQLLISSGQTSRQSKGIWIFAWSCHSVLIETSGDWFGSGVGEGD